MTRASQPRMVYVHFNIPYILNITPPQVDLARRARSASKHSLTPPFRTLLFNTTSCSPSYLPISSRCRSSSIFVSSRRARHWQEKLAKVPLVCLDTVPIYPRPSSRNPHTTTVITYHPQAYRQHWQRHGVPETEAEARRETFLCVKTWRKRGPSRARPRPRRGRGRPPPPRSAARMMNLRQSRRGSRLPQRPYISLERMRSRCCYLKIQAVSPPIYAVPHWLNAFSLFRDGIRCRGRRYCILYEWNWVRKSFSKRVHYRSRVLGRRGWVVRAGECGYSGSRPRGRLNCLLQITGCMDSSQFPFASDDDGGQFDNRFPNGAQCTFGGYGASFIEL